MTKTELRLEYQKVTGDSLDSINRKAECGDPDYIQWLEEIAMKGANKAIQGIPLIKGFVAITDFFNASNKTR